MSLVSQILALTTRVAAEAKSIRTLVNGNNADLSALNTSNKSNLVAAINEVFASSGGSVNLDNLGDVTITTPTSGHIVRYNGSQWVNVLGTAQFDAFGSASAAQAASQPANVNLDALAALTTTAFGRSLLEKVDSAALMAILSAASTTAAGIVELATNTEALAGTDTSRAVTPAGVKALVDSVIDAAPGAMDTLNELAAALGDDPNFATTMTNSLAGKQAITPLLTSILGLATAADKYIYFTAANTAALGTITTFGRSVASLADAAAGRTLLDVYSTTDIGSPTTNFVTTFEAGLV